ncbi:MAG: hypothetical protein ACLVAU_11755 [Ruminococcus sp.]
MSRVIKTAWRYLDSIAGRTNSQSLKQPIISGAWTECAKAVSAVRSAQRSSSYARSCCKYAAQNDIIDKNYAML